jgi:signal transduction histidine kinase
MNLRRAQSLTLALAVASVILADVVSFAPGILGTGGHAQQHLLLAILLPAGVLPFTLLIFHFGLTPVYRTINAQNQELHRLNEAARRHAAQVQAIHEAGSALTAELSQDVVGQAIVDLTRELVQADEVHLALTATQGSGPPAAWGEPLTAALPAREEVGLLYKGAVIGTLSVGRESAAQRFTREDRSLLQLFATEAVIALENARLHDRVRDLAVLEERERLAQELHDGFAQALAYVNTKTQAIQECLVQGETQAALALSNELVQSVRALSEEVRSEIGGLWASTDIDRPFDIVVAEYVARFADQSQIQAHLVDDEHVLQHISLDIRERVQAFRIVQEALTNVRRHARAKRVRVRCSREAKGAQVEIEDDGCGFVPKEVRQGYGLRTMQQRAASIGGRLGVCSRPGAGTRVCLYVPMPSQPPRAVP